MREDIADERIYVTFTTKSNIKKAALRIPSYGQRRIVAVVSVTIDTRLALQQAKHKHGTVVRDEWHRWQTAHACVGAEVQLSVGHAGKRTPIRVASPPSVKVVSSAVKAARSMDGCSRARRH